jgi:hypothetical protein
MDENNQHLYILILTKVLYDVYIDLKLLSEEFLSKFNEFIINKNDSKPNEILIKLFSDEITEINKHLLNELFDILKSQNQKLKRNNSTEYNYVGMNIIKNFFPNESMFNLLFLKSQESNND